MPIALTPQGIAIASTLGKEQLRTFLDASPTPRPSDATSLSRSPALGSGELAYHYVACSLVARMSHYQILSGRYVPEPNPSRTQPQAYRKGGLAPDWEAVARLILPESLYKSHGPFSWRRGMSSAWHTAPLAKTSRGGTFRTIKPSPTMRPVEVVHRAAVTADAVSLWLAEPGSTLAPAPYLPGQFITLAVPLEGEVLYRSYSLCGDGHADHPWRITIKRAGVVSDALCREVVPGDQLYSTPPRGAFTLPSCLPTDVPLVFVAAGSGITPIYGMLSALAGMPNVMRPPVYLHYASHTLEDMLFRRELVRLDPTSRWLRQWHYISMQGDRISFESVRMGVAGAARTAQWYISAPEMLKNELLRKLHNIGVPQEHVHMEVFAAPKVRAQALSVPLGDRVARRSRASRASRVQIAGTKAALDVRPDETILECLERHNYRPAFGCRAGVCGECKLRVLDGHVVDEGDNVLTPSERSQGMVLACTALPLGPVTIAARGQLQAAASRAYVRSRPESQTGSSRALAFKAIVRLGLLAAMLAVFVVSWLMATPGSGIVP